jgi:hypothetical protein
MNSPAYVSWMGALVICRFVLLFHRFLFLLRSFLMIVFRVSLPTACLVHD